jgi:zinc transport system substrate-binding protein
MLIAAAVFGCANTEPAQQPTKPEISTTFYPTTYMTKRIAGNLATITCPLPTDEDPITWMPDSATIAAYQQADLVIVNGADFEKWVAKVSLPPSRIVNTAAPLADSFVRFKTAISHSHGPAGRHDHTGIDGHTWLDPQNAKIQAAEIRNALIKLLPDHADKLNTNYAALAADLDALDASLAQLAKQLKDRSPLASHPAYNYLARRYEWNITNLDLDPEVELSDETIANMRKQIEQIAPRPKVILWEQQPIAAVIGRLENDLGLASVVFSPCEQAPAKGDYLSAMHDNIKRLQAALSLE